MYRATKDIVLPTTITGSLPRPSWYTENLAGRSFLDAMVNNQFREQYVDTVSVYLHEQETAGLDIVLLFVGVGATLFCYLLFKSRAIPRPLAGWAKTRPRRCGCGWGRLW